MDDLVSKTQELTNLVTSLRGQGEDDSDLQGILAQLQAAVAKRAGTSSTESPIADLTAKSEPVDTFDSPEITPVVRIDLPLDNRTGDLISAIILPGDGSETDEHPISPGTSYPMPAKKTPSQAKKRQSKAKPAAKRKAKKKAIVESESDLEPEYDENEEDAEFSPTKYYQDLETFEPESLDEGDMTLASFVNPVTGALEDEPYRSPTTKRKPKKSVFKATCKICEVEASIRAKANTDTDYPTDPSSSLYNKQQVYSSVTIFSMHIKNDHTIPGEIQYNREDSEEDDGFAPSFSTTQPAADASIPSAADMAGITPAPDSNDLTAGDTDPTLNADTAEAKQDPDTVNGTEQGQLNDDLHVEMPPVLTPTALAAVDNSEGYVQVPATVIQPDLLHQPISDPNVPIIIHQTPLDYNQGVLSGQLTGGDSIGNTEAPASAGTGIEVDAAGINASVEWSPSLKKQSSRDNCSSTQLVCPHCDKRYNMYGTTKSCYDQLVVHMHKKHAEALPPHVTLHSCEECQFQTLRQRDLDRHMFVVHTDHKPRGIPCKICGKRVLRTSMMFHMAAVHDSEDVPDQVKARTLRIPCQHCGRGFRGEINLQRHIQCVHSKIRDQLCHLCSQSFFAKRELQLHMFSCHKINMSNMKVYSCPAEGCNYETIAKRHLHIHSTVHTDTKDFTCEHCGKAFKSKPALSQHIRIMHTLDVQYTCPKCSFSSHAKQYVQRHMVVHSDNKRHKCDFEGCSYATHFIENLTKHKRKHQAKE